MILQVQYGQLKSCFKVSATGNTQCIIEVFYKELKDNHQVYTEQECPVLQRSSHLLTILSTAVLSPVSVVHRCDSKCRLETIRKRKRLEREFVDVNSLGLKHNIKNKFYALNIYSAKFLSLGNR